MLVGSASINAAPPGFVEGHLKIISPKEGKSKFTPDTFGDTVSSIYDAGTISSGDPRISVVNSFSVPAGGSYNLTVTINPNHTNGIAGQYVDDSEQF